MPSFFDTPIEFLKGVGPQRAALLNKELNIFTYGDLLVHFPFRYEDRTRFYSVSEITDDLPFVQLKGTISRKQVILAGRKRMTAQFSDETGMLELVWFQGLTWVGNNIREGAQYVVFGRPNRFGKTWSIVHPEFEVLTEASDRGGYFQPVYPLTEKLRTRRLDSKAITKLMRELLNQGAAKITENLPATVIRERKLISKKEALVQVHFPENPKSLSQAQRRLKFEELLIVQLRLLRMKLIRLDKFKGQVFDNPALLTRFYNEHLPYQLTEAQKRVVKEIYADLKSGKQMNRLLQGDVGSGKTVVAFICMLIAIGSGAQCALMAPTEILAQQHYKNLRAFADKLHIPIALLTGSTKKSERKQIHEALAGDVLKIIVGTHALIEEEVRFHNLGLAVIDEQHRFGVAQRSKLWKKNAVLVPHILVMTATPIPRTLAMTLYGDLNISVIDEMPKGRKPIKTIHKYDAHRLEINRFLQSQIDAGRQVYIVYPLIDESEKLDLKHLHDGYESITRAFPEVPVSILHGKMTPDAKEFEMARFVKGETKIMVSTSVIEVGVDVPNASVMVIENAERFGLSQLHQLRGRVGRGAAQSYCVLVTDYKLSAESKTRIETMVRTNDGFQIAETDLKLRGPGDLAGTQQSGMVMLRIADLARDQEILREARNAASDLLKSDPELTAPENRMLKNAVESKRGELNWSRIG